MHFYHAVNGCEYQSHMVISYANISEMVQLTIEQRVFVINKFHEKKPAVMQASLFTPLALTCLLHETFNVHNTKTWKKCNLTLLSLKLMCSVMHDIYQHSLVPMERR